MVDLKPGAGADLLQGELNFSELRVARYQPNPRLADLIEHYWTASWALEDGLFARHFTLPDPAAQLVIEVGRSEVYGPMLGSFRRDLHGEGRIIAIKFTAAGFYPFCRQEVALVSEKRLPASRWFSPLSVSLLESEVFELSSEQEMMLQVDEAMQGCVDVFGSRVGEVNRWVKLAREGHGFLRVEELAECAGCSVRTLQRGFRRYVGLSPQRVLRHSHLTRSIEPLVDHPAPDYSRLALDLGYSDQRDLEYDFRAIVGVDLEVYRRAQRVY